MFRFSSYYPIALFCIASATPICARGQDKLTPSTKPAPPPVPTVPESSTKNKKTAEKEKPVERSKMSLRLEDKLLIGSGMGYSTISGSKGTWTAGLAGDIGIGYRFARDVIAGGDGIATFRFVPTDVTVTSDAENYEGVVEMYNFGFTWEKTEGNMSYLAAAELGLLSISLSSIDDNVEDTSYEDGSFVALVGGGADWIVLEKVKAGPRLYAGFGGVSYFQLAGSVSFIF